MAYLRADWRALLRSRRPGAGCVDASAAALSCWHLGRAFAGPVPLEVITVAVRWYRGYALLLSNAGAPVHNAHTQRCHLPVGPGQLGQQLPVGNWQSGRISPYAAEANTKPWNSPAG